ncbi:hypothetical protein [Mesorhizobium australicum]|uniref:hypothetical protein n=1 Tax=Mesorhizobium australicum TaxID=536018 RepID=UPI00333B3C93
MSVRIDRTPFIVTADQLTDDFVAVAKLAGVELYADAVLIERLPAPHVPPTRLPQGRMAVYVFARGSEVLKVGKVGAKSQARYTSQHYNAGSALSTLAASILAESGRHGLTEQTSRELANGLGRTSIASIF